MTRRTAIALSAASLILPREANPQSAAERDGGPRTGDTQKPGTMPLLCAYSNNLARVPYAELGLIAQQIGYDGVDLTVMTGGHVSPQITNVDLVRAIESVRGANLEVPLISTQITTVNDPTAYPILAITGHTQVHMYRTGFWEYGTIPPRIRLGEVNREITSLLTLGQRTEMTAVIPNRAGRYVGAALWDMELAIAGMAPRWIGYSFNPAQATATGAEGGWETTLEIILPRVKAVAILFAVQP